MKKTLLLLSFFWMAQCVFAGQLTTGKFTAKAGQERGLDSVQFAGLMDASEPNILAAAEIVVSLDCNDMTVPVQWAFPVNELAYKNGQYNYARTENASVSLLKFNPATGVVLFNAKNVDLTGLACPITVMITIGDYSAQAELDETIVNTTKSCPLQFLMGVRNTMRVDKVMVKLGSKPGTDSVSVQGGFSVAEDCNMSESMIAALGNQAFTVCGDQFIPQGALESCKTYCLEGPCVNAQFDFSKCVYKLQIKNAVIDESGVVGFTLDCFGNELPEQDIVLPTSLCQRYELERYRCYNQLGRDCTYSAAYSIEDSEGITDDYGTMSVSVSVEDNPVMINGHECFSVEASTAGATIATSWYEDYYGTHEYGWGSIGDDLISFETQISSMLSVPKYLCVGQTHADSGTFTGEFDLDIDSGYDYEIDIYDFKGTAAASTTLLGFESVTVPYDGGTTYNDAAKVKTILILKGTMVIQVYDPYWDEYWRGKANFQATINQTWWGVEDMGVVKSDSVMQLKLSVAGENIWINMTETDELTDYDP